MSCFMFGLKHTDVTASLWPRKERSRVGSSGCEDSLAILFFYRPLTQNIIVATKRHIGEFCPRGAPSALQCKDLQPCALCVSTEDTPRHDSWACVEIEFGVKLEFGFGISLGAPPWPCSLQLAWVLGVARKLARSLAFWQHSVSQAAFGPNQYLLVGAS